MANSNNLTLTFSDTSNDPAKVIRFHHGHGDEVPQGALVDPGMVLVTFLAAPINPQDLLAIAGRYPVKAQYRHAGEPIPGNDGVARVEAVGADAPHAPPSTSILQPGDLVIPRRHGLGTWRQRAVLPVDALQRLPLSPNSAPSRGPAPAPGWDPVAASMLRTVFTPAYLLVEDMRALRPGDWVVQNAGRSAIAQLVTQFVRRKGASVVSVVRDTDLSAQAASTDFETQAQAQHAPLPTNADIVVPESRVIARGTAAHPALAAAAAQGRVVLALDAVFGRAGEQLAALLSKGATYVNYGSLGGATGAGHPEAELRVSQKLLFWSEVQLRNFRLSEQLGLRSRDEQETMLAWFADLVACGELKAPKMERIAVPGDAEADQVQFEQRVREVLTAGAERKQRGLQKHVFVFETGIAEGT
ncbi:Alcohol dehydrogenase superfamily, zinc-type [Niveomyces insectorum RCEF 264]|uniref:Alcohol dehydrogenase superfamily, zinc-type n=1 Tax=Niveomyces insectorum RCEF 264 TaxID=1081102 RepID=A0A167MM68_9HYPO|nr:Alcohol dehydrogenase superfamily, zinc-type [Niveomyces insectorum RCEF 264]